MAWSITDWFPSWGATGSKPASGFQYQGGDQVNEKHLDYLWYAVGQLEAEVRAALTDLDSDGDGIVDEADSVTAGGVLNGNLVDSAANVVYDDTSKHVPTVRLQADTDGDGLIEDFDEALLKDGGSRELDAEELSGSLGTAGQIIETDGAALNYVEPDGRYSPAAHAASHKDGGADELDASELSGALGTNGSVLISDGNAASWSTTAGADPIYGDGADGAITRSANLNENGIIRATDYTLNSGVTATVTSGTLIILATNSITINGTINADGQGGNGGGGGYPGGNGGNGLFKPIGLGGSGGGSGEEPGGDGGDGDTGSPTLVDLLPTTLGTLLELNTSPYTGGAGGGGGGSGNSFIGGSGQGNGGNGSFPGGGGGGAYDRDTSSSEGSGGSGGDGGGLVVLISPNITVNGAITADGQNGSNGGGGVHVGGGGGGGGSGGVVTLVGRAISTPGSITASAGTGGAGGNGTFDGGDGANGEAGVVLTVTV